MKVLLPLKILFCYTFLIKFLIRVVMFEKLLICKFSNITGDVHNWQ